MPAHMETVLVTEQEHPSSRLSGRLTRASLAIVVALVIGIVVSVVAGTGSAAPGGRLGGDLPAFYGAGRIAADGNWDALYDSEAQIAAQADLWEEEGAYLYFAYPPHVAAVYRGLVPFGYRGAFLIHTTLMAAALLAAIWLMRPLFPVLGRLPIIVPFAAALTFYPMARAVLGGQNSALTLLLFAVVLRLEAAGRPVGAGVAAALLLYKPQFGVPLLLLLLVGRRWRMLAGWSVTAIVGYLAGAALLGAGWVTNWWDQAAGFRDLNVAANGKNFISVPGFAEQVWGASAGTVALVVAGAVGGLAAALVWWASPGRPDLRMAVAISVIIAVAPQPLYYDAGALILPVLVLVTVRPRADIAVVVTAWLAGLVHLAEPLLHASPLVVFVVVVAGAAVWISSSEERRRLSLV